MKLYAVNGMVSVYNSTVKDPMVVLIVAILRGVGGGWNGARYGSNDDATSNGCKNATENGVSCTKICTITHGIIKLCRARTLFGIVWSFARTRRRNDVDVEPDSIHL